MADLFCVCGNPVKNRVYCSERCKYIIEQMSTPLGMNMSQQRAVRFFGKQWDKKQGDKKK